MVSAKIEKACRLFVGVSVYANFNSRPMFVNVAFSTAGGIWEGESKLCVALQLSGVLKRVRRLR